MMLIFQNSFLRGFVGHLLKQAKPTWLAQARRAIDPRSAPCSMKLGTEDCPSERHFTKAEILTRWGALLFPALVCDMTD